MSVIPNNWSAVFKNAAGNDVFHAGGHVSELTMDIKTAQTFLFKALVQIAEQDIETQNMGCDVIPTRDTWKKALVNAIPFGIADVEFDYADVSDATIRSATEMAEHNILNMPS